MKKKKKPVTCHNKSIPKGQLGVYIRKAMRQGWTGHRTSKHYRLVSPDGKTLIHCPVTTRRPRSINNTRALMRQNGVEL